MKSNYSSLRRQPAPIRKSARKSPQPHLATAAIPLSTNPRVGRVTPCAPADRVQTACEPGEAFGVRAHPAAFRWVKVGRVTPCAPAGRVQAAWELGEAFGMRAHPGASLWDKVARVTPWPTLGRVKRG